MTAVDVVKLLKEAGWYEIRMRGSHKQFPHDIRPGTVTVPMHHGDLSKGTLNSILRQAGLKE